MGTLKVDNIQSSTDGSVSFPQGLSSSTQPLSIPNGSVSSPSIRFDTDTDTGLYRIGANTIGISNGGNETARIDSNGNLSLSGSINPNNSISLRNKVINGNFDFWQRGTSLGSASGGRFLADRWYNDSIGSTYTLSQQPFTLGQTDVPNEPSFFNRIVVTSVAGVGNTCVFRQRIESVRTLAGKTATLSFWAKADSSKSIAIEFFQIFGTGGSPSAGAFGIGVTTCSLTSSWQKFTVTTNIPSISGKTLGTNGDDFLQFNFWFDAGSNYNSRTNSLGQQSGTFDIAQVQLEEGSVATPFEVRPQGLELSLCRRYYRRGRVGNPNGNAIFFTTHFGGTNIYLIEHDVGFDEMRVAPTLTLLNSSNFQHYSYGAVWTNTTLSISNYFNGYSITAVSDGDGRGKLGRLNNTNNVFLEWEGTSEL